MDVPNPGAVPAEGVPAESPPADETIPAEGGESPPPEEQKRSPNAEKRIGQLVAEREYWRGKAEATPVPAPTPAPAPKKELKPADFNSDSDYLKAVVAQTRDELRAEMKQELGRTRKETAAAEAQRTLAEARSKHEDFDSVALNPTLPITKSMVDAAMGDNYGDILYALGSEPDEARRISALTPVQQIKEIGKIESRLNSKPKPKTSSAPTPPKTVSGGGGSPAPKAEKDMSFAEKTAKWTKDREEAVRKRYGQ